MLGIINKAVTWVQYQFLVAFGRLRGHGRGEPSPAADGFSNDDLRGYPNNHNYRIDDGRLIPNFNLFWRAARLQPLYTKEVGSLLDIGSARGWFVLEAARTPGCRLAVGIDIFEPWIELSRKVAKKLACDNARFHYGFLTDLAGDPDTLGAPFDNILIINTYHYLFWGSGLSDKRFDDHDAAIAALARICSGRVIFANPLDLPDVPRETRDIAALEPERAKTYTTEAFTRAARRHFDVEPHGTIGKRTLLVLKKRTD
ncbi:MAG: class I SAM-dependent methyltransferase [Pseudomonadales bacterium]|nr:class I SAM-dependent methyltransferase [Pseudomonadales bacterium]